MTDVFHNKTNDVQKGFSADGLITNVAPGDLGNADTSYTYFNLAPLGFDAFSLDMNITATTITIEASNSDLFIDNEALELIQASNDRDFGGAGNWAADGSGASVAVNAGGLDVTVGVADTGAKLDQDYFKDAESLMGFRAGKKYTVTLDIASLSGGNVTVLAGDQIIASGLTNGAAQSFTFTAKKHHYKLSVVGTTAAATFTIDDVSIQTYGDDRDWETMI